MNKTAKQISFDEAFDLVKKGEIVHALYQLKSGYSIKILNKLPIEKITACKDAYIFIVIKEG